MNYLITLIPLLVTNAITVAGWIHERRARKASEAAKYAASIEEILASHQKLVDLILDCRQKLLESK